METVRAVVEKVVEKGRHGPYAVAKVGGVKGSITFSLQSPCWMEERRPGGGVFVVLSKLERVRAGWRALEARLMQPTDERKEA